VVGKQQIHQQAIGRSPPGNFDDLHFHAEARTAQISCRLEPCGVGRSSAPGDPDPDHAATVRKAAGFAAITAAAGEGGGRATSEAEATLVAAWGYDLWQSATPFGGAADRAAAPLGVVIML